MTGWTWEKHQRQEEDPGYDNIIAEKIWYGNPAPRKSSTRDAERTNASSKTADKRRAAEEGSLSVRLSFYLIYLKGGRGRGSTAKINVANRLVVRLLEHLAEAV